MDIYFEVQFLTQPINSIAMKTKLKVILDIITAPVTFQVLGNKSFYDLIKETGYFENSNKVFEDDIAYVLLDNSELIEKWFEWSENKRSSDGWYLLTNDSRKYEVGRIDEEGKRGQFLEFTDKRNACAVFIKREIDELREH